MDSRQLGLGGEEEQIVEKEKKKKSKNIPFLNLKMCELIILQTKLQVCKENTISLSLCICYVRLPLALTEDFYLCSKSSSGMKQFNQEH